MLHLVLGPVHSGKSHYFQSVISDNLEKENQIFYIVPEQLSYETERSFLNNFGIAGANRIRILTFTKLCEEIIVKIGGQQAQTIDESLKTVCMMTALQNLSGSLQYYKKGGKSLNFAKSMLAIIDEFKQSGIISSDIEKIMPKISSGNLAEKLQDITLIYNTYNAVLQNRFIDPNDRILYCASHIADKPIYKDTIFIFDAFDGFMPNQHRLIEIIMQQADDVYISLPCDGELYIENDMSVFANVRKEARNLLSVAEKNCVAAAKPIILSETNYKNPELKQLEYVLSERNEDVFNENAKHISLIKAPNSYDELNYICFEIKRLVSQEGYRYRDFAIVSRECESYSGTFESIASKYKIPVFFDKRHTLIYMPLYRLLLSALHAADKLTSDSVFSMLKSGLLSFSLEEIAQLENYCYIWSIDRLEWFDEWTKNPSGLEREDASTKERLDKLNSLRKSVTKIITELRNDLGNTVTDITKALYHFIVKNNITNSLQELSEKLKNENDFENAQHQIASYDNIVSVFNKLNACDDGRKITVDAYIELFFACSNTETVGAVPYNLDMAMFCSSDRARVTNAKIVFMLGVNQGIQPRLGNPSGLFSTGERQTLIASGIDICDNLISASIDEKFKFYASACAASERVYFCYSLSDFSMQTLEPSYIIEQLALLFPNCRKICCDNLESMPISDYYDKQPAFEKTVSLLSNDSSEIASAKAYFTEDIEFASKLSNIRNNKSADYSLAPDIAKKLYGNQINLSASQIEAFHKCVFSYFCRYGIGAKPILKAEIDAIRRGTLIHYYLEKFINKHMKDYAQLDDTEISEEIEWISYDYLNELGLQESDLTQQLLYIFTDIKNQIFFLIKDIINELSNSDFEPVACELHIDKNSEIKPLTVAFAGGDISVRGFVDRVDIAEIESENYVRIIDYKTNSKKFKLNDLLYGLNIQMLLHLYAIVNEKPYKIGGILYKPAKQLIVEAGGEEEIAIKSNGLVLRDEKVIQAMDKTGNYISAGFKKGVVLEKDTATTQEFSLIFEAIDKLIADMGNRLHGGLISAKPIKDDKTPCEYCEYRAVCLTEDDRACRMIEKRSDKDAISELERRMQNGY